MSQTLVNAAQYEIVFDGDCSYLNLGTGNEVVVNVPAGFELIDVCVYIDTAFNGTTPAFNVADNMSSPNTLIASTAATATGPTSLISTFKMLYYPTGAQIIFSFTSGAGATAGAGRISVRGVIHGRENERIGA